MKFRNINLLLSACLILFVTCKSDDEYSNASPVRLKTKANMEAGVMSYYNQYEYDTFGRMIKQTMVQGEKSALYIVAYTEKSIMGHVSGDDYKTPCVYYYYLNSSGLADSTFCSSGDQIYFQIKSKYDAAGHLIWEDCHSPAYGYHSVTDYLFEKGNVTKCIYHETTFPPTLKAANFHSEELMKRTLALTGSVRYDRLSKFQSRMDQSGFKSLEAFSDTTFYEYAFDLNTIDLNNMGFAFKGVQSKNLPTKETVHDATSTKVYPYTYETDRKGRITKSIKGDADISYFTYTDQIFTDLK